MRVVIVGGGKVGGYLARELSATRHTVVVIEADADRAQRLAEEKQGLVIHGDGTDIETLLSADVDRADWLIAVTGHDEVNLVGCELASTLGVRRTLARLNDPRNRSTFSALKIPVVAVTDLIGEVIERELEREQIDRIAMLGGGAVSVIEVEIAEGVPARSVATIDLPAQSLVITVVNPDGLAIVPNAETILRSGDRVVAVTSLDNEPAVRDALRGVSS